MRLIDADAFIEYLGLDVENSREDNLGEIVTLEDFDRQPTAYDLDKVVEQLEILLEKETALICRHVSDASYMAAVIGHTMLVDAIEVVRTGGTGIKITKSGGAADE